MKKNLLIALMIMAMLITGCSSTKNEGASDVADYSNTTETTEPAEEKVTGTTTTTTTTSTEVTITTDYDKNGENALIYRGKPDGHWIENRFQDVEDNPLSTFSIDVDTAAYSNVRRMILDGYEPDSGSVRIEEMINYFDYDYEGAKGNANFAVTTEMGTCPWEPEHKIALIGIKGKEMNEQINSNLVFLLDVSGSMSRPEKLPLLKSGFKMLLESLGKQDRISVVVYAGSSGVVIDGARGDEKDYIKDKLNELEAGGSTAGASGINLAYKLAEKHFIEGGNNRVILATDGDFNVGPSSENALEELIEQKRESGVFLSVLGFGTDNFQDRKMETLADKGNGNFYYLDTLYEAKKVLVDDLSGMLFAIAKDVKIQVEFNPENVQAYKLIGYENRMLNKEDFNDDQVDAGELGAGHTVTALYEIVPHGSNYKGHVDDLKYQENDKEKTTEAHNGSNYKDEWMTVKLRYKNPDSDQSIKVEKIIRSKDFSIMPSGNFNFATAVAEFGMVLRGDIYHSTETLNEIISRGEKGIEGDDFGYRMEFINLVEIYKSIL